MTFEVACARAMIYLDLQNTASVWEQDDERFFSETLQAPFVAEVIGRQFDHWAAIAKRLDPEAWEERFKWTG